MTATYIFDVFSSLDGYGVASANLGLLLEPGDDVECDRRERKMPATAVSTTLEEPVAVARQPVDERALMAAPSGRPRSGDALPGHPGLTRSSRVRADFDLELFESRTLDGHIQELVYRPTLHV